MKNSCFAAFSVWLLIVSCAFPKEEVLVVKMDSPAKTGAEPFLVTNEYNQVYLSWIEKQDTISYLKYSKLKDEAWMPPVTIASGAEWFVNWADYPMVAESKGNYLAHFLKKSGDGTFAYDINVTTSHDGIRWSEPFVLHDDKKQAEHGFVTMIPDGNNFFITWLDGRNTVMEGMENMNHHEGHHGAMSLRAAIIDPTGVKLNEWELDAKTCDCCQTTATLTDKGPVVIYRDRSDEEIRDISIVRFINGTWTPPQPVYKDNWKIAGCPVNGPRVGSLGNTLAVTWFTAAQDSAKVYVAFSENGGESFNAPIQINEGSTIGRVDIVLLDNDRAAVSWMEDATLKARIVNKNGTKSTPWQIATSSVSRSSGFPQMTKRDNGLLFAWTDEQEKNIKISFLTIPD